MAMGDVPVNFAGSLGNDPELRFTPSGAAVANFSVASTPRIKDNQTGEWKDGETTWLRCNIWRTAAENVANSLKRGDRVVVQGRLKMRSFETKEGEKRSVMEVDVDEIGVSLKFHPAASQRPERSGGGQQQRGQSTNDDPWGSAPQGGGYGGGSAGGFADEPPF